jgi:hypothetical protein
MPTCRGGVRLVVLAVLCLGFVSRPRAADPSSGTISPGSGPLVYTGGPFDFTNMTAVPATPAAPGQPPVCLDPLLPCDDFALTVTVTPGDPTVYFLRVDLQFLNTSSDFDLYLFDSSGTMLKDSTGTTGEQEAVQVQAQPGTHTFTVQVVPYDVVTGAGGDVYSATVQLLPNAIPPEPPLQPTVAGRPRYENYAAPAGMGNGAGEPTLGVNLQSGNVLYIAGLDTLKVGFDDCASPAATSWQDVSFTTTGTTSLDPILFTDPATHRTFVSQLTGACSLTAFTDDDGATWTPSQGCGTPAGADHQTIGGGPFPASDPIGPTAEYPHAVYYCSQSVATSFCALSRDGGLTFGPGVPAWNLTQCGAIHGHLKVAPDGTVYVPVKNCGTPAQTAVVVSEDAGTTWSVRPIPGSTGTYNGVLTDPSVGIGAGGRVYLGYQRDDGHAWIATSDDKGLTWRDHQDVGAALGIRSIVFPAVVAGHDDRAAFAFLGTQQEGDYQNPSAFHGSWHLYVAHSFDGGATWTTVDATPLDPVQRGSICNEGTTCSNVPDDRNLLDFIDAQVDGQGRVLVSFADGCITQSCIAAGVNDFTSKAVIARQSGGRRLFPQFDPVEPGVPKAPRLSAARVAPGVVRLTWTLPDNGGADVTQFHVYRGITSGGETSLATTSSKGSYLDITADPATGYYYRIAAVNEAGEGPVCSEVFVAPGVPPGTDPCTTPGVRAAVDASDAPPNAPPTAAVDVQSLSVAEPYGTDGSARLVFTLQVGEAVSAPAGSQWYVLWNRPVPDGNGDRNYVAMKTDAVGVPSFEYGRVSPPNANLPTRLGSADDGSYDPTSGTVRIVVSNDHVDFVTAGQTLSVLQARTFLARPDGLPVTSTSASDVSAEGQYTLVGNASCRSNAPPRAELTREPATGCAPTTVNFDASSSSDPDPGDTIASYLFDFGDSSPAVLQASPTISHTYTAAGVFAARLHVTDSRGRISQNVDQEEIDLSPCAVEEVGALSWSEKDTLSWPAATGAVSYRLHRGAPATYSALLDPAVDSCVRFEGTGTATGPVLQELPATGGLYWYLVVGMGNSVAGPAGEATAGPRVLDASGVCP